MKTEDTHEHKWSSKADKDTTNWDLVVEECIQDLSIQEDEVEDFLDSTRLNEQGE